MEGTAKTRSHSLKSVLFQWETMIFVIFIIINIININLSSNYLNFNNMMNNMVVFMDKALMVFTTMMVLLLGEIDISIASIMCLSGCCCVRGRAAHCSGHDGGTAGGGRLRLL